MRYSSEPHQYIIKIFKNKKRSFKFLKEKKIKYKKFSLLLLLNKFNQESREIFSLLSFSPHLSFYKKGKCSKREGGGGGGRVEDAGC